MANIKYAWGSYLRIQNWAQQETRRGHSENQTLPVSTVDSLTHSLTDTGKAILEFQCIRTKLQLILQRGSKSPAFQTLCAHGILSYIWQSTFKTVKGQAKCSRAYYYYYYYLNSRSYVQKEVKHCNSTKSILPRGVTIQ